MRRGLRDALISLGAVALVAAALVALDDRVRDYMTYLVRNMSSPSGLSAATVYARDFGAILLLAVKDQTIEHAPLVVFALAAAVLTLFMLRT